MSTSNVYNVNANVNVVIRAQTLLQAMREEQLDSLKRIADGVQQVETKRKKKKKHSVFLLLCCIPVWGEKVKFLVPRVSTLLSFFF